MIRSREILSLPMASLVAIASAAPAFAGGWHHHKEKVILVPAEPRTVRVIERVIIRETAPAAQTPSGQATRELPQQRDLTFERSVRALALEPSETDRDIAADRSLRALTEERETTERYYIREAAPVERIRVREVAPVERVIVREVAPVERVIIREVQPATRAILVEPAKKHHFLHH